jgi:hypothetical protein
MNQEDYEEEQFPVETLQVYDLIGIGFQILGNVLGAVGGGCHALGREFYSAARLRRQREEIELYRREQGFALERLIEGEDRG